MPSASLLPPRILPSFLGHAVRWYPDLAQHETEPIIWPEDLVLPRHYVAEVLCVYGFRGQGKSTLTTALGQYMMEAYKAAGARVKVVANYWVRFANHWSPMLVDEIISFPPWLRNRLMLIDEVTEFIPSSLAMSADSRHVASLVRQIRKRGLDIIANTQFPIELQRAFLRQVNLFLETEAHFRRGGKLDIKIYVYDYWGHYTGDWRRKMWPPPRHEADNVVWMNNAHVVFRDFNTEEVQVERKLANRDEVLSEQYTAAQLRQIQQRARPGQDAPEKSQFKQGEKDAEAEGLQHYLLTKCLQSDGGINLSMTLRNAIELEPNIQDGPGYKRWLQEHGWRLEHSGSGTLPWVALYEGGGS